MFAALFSLAYAILLFGLTAEAETPFLKIAGTIAAVYMTIAGSYLGWRAARDE